MGLNSHKKHHNFGSHVKGCSYAVKNFVLQTAAKVESSLHCSFPDPSNTYVVNEFKANPPRQEVTINMQALSDALPEHPVPGTTECSVKLEGYILGEFVFYETRIYISNIVVL